MAMNPKRKNLWSKGLILVALTAAITWAHWITPDPSVGHVYHAIHILLRKLYLLPVVMGAIWLGLRGALVAGLLVSFAYGPYINNLWRHARTEGVNDFGELASIWVVALIAGWLSSREKSLLTELNAMLEATLESLVAALDWREHSTALHSRRVQAISLWLAHRLRLSDREMEILRRGSLLHDVGKIGVPDRILLNTDPLTPEEWEVIRQHPTMGMSIVGGIPSMKESAAIVKYHHERYDGSGYPEGLAGEQIPWGARIFAVADSLDAMTSQRPYQQPMAFAEAKRQILSESGTLFDPVVIQALAAMDNEDWRLLNEQVSKQAKNKAAVTS